MKNKTLIIAALTAALAASFGHQSEAHSTAVTKTYGYLELTNDVESKNTNVFHRTPRWQGRVLSASGATITVEGSPGFTPALLTGGNNKHYAIFRSGSLEGEFFDVTLVPNANQVTLQVSNLTGLNPGDVVAIIPHQTLNTMFPAGAHVHPAASYTAVTTGTAIYKFFDNSSPAVMRAINSNHYYFNANLLGWRQVVPSLNVGDSTVFRPTEAYVVRHHGNGALTQLQSGWVFEEDIAIPLYRDASQHNMHYVGIPRPVPYTVSQLGLNTSNFSTSSSFAAFSSHPQGASDGVRLLAPTSANLNYAPDSAAIYYNSTNFIRVFTNVSNAVSISSFTPAFPPGRVVAIMRAPGTSATDDLINQKNWP